MKLQACAAAKAAGCIMEIENCKDIKQMEHGVSSDRTPESHSYQLITIIGLFTTVWRLQSY